MQSRMGAYGGVPPYVYISRSSYYIYSMYTLLIQIPIERYHYQSSANICSYIKSTRVDRSILPYLFLFLVWFDLTLEPLKFLLLESAAPLGRG